LRDAVRIEPLDGTIGGLNDGAIRRLRIRGQWRPKKNRECAN
jgi:hypothetical protein